MPQHLMIKDSSQILKKAGRCSCKPNKSHKTKFKTNLQLVNISDGVCVCVEMNCLLTVLAFHFPET